MAFDDLVEFVLNNALGPFSTLSRAGQLGTATGGEDFDQPFIDFLVDEGLIEESDISGLSLEEQREVVERSLSGKELERLMSVTDSPNEYGSEDLQTLYFQGQPPSGGTVKTEVEAQRDAKIHGVITGDTGTTGKAFHMAIRLWLGGGNPFLDNAVSTGELATVDRDGFMIEYDMTQESANGVGYDDSKYIQFPIPVNWNQGVTLNCQMEEFSGTNTDAMDISLLYTVGEGSGPLV